MATAKIVTWPRPNKDGQFPIGIKIWKNGKPSYIFEGYTLASRDLWDAKKQEVKKSVPNSARLTNYLRKKLSNVTDKALEMETNETAISAKAIKAEVKPKEDKNKSVFFKQVADEYLADHLACGDFDEFVSDRGRLKRFYIFTKDRDIEFSAITVDFLKRYKLYLESCYSFQSKKKKPLSETTILNHLIIVRTIYNRAITKKIASRDHYPFEKQGGIPIKPVKTAKIGLLESEIKKLEEAIFPDQLSYLNDTRNIWLISFYFAGMRITDALLLKSSDFQNGRLYYTMSKNGKTGSLKVPEKVIAILEQYKDHNRTHDLIFPHLQCLDDLDNRLLLRKRISSVSNTLRVHMTKIMTLLEIDKNASPHKSRHSFAQRAEEKNVHPKVLQKMYRHSSIVTTMNYQSNFSHEKADEALDAVICF